MPRSYRLILPAVVLTVFVLLVAGLALFYRFPYRQAAQALKARVEAEGPVRLAFSGPEVGSPFTLRLGRPSVSLALPEGDWPILTGDELLMDLAPWSLVWGRAASGFNLRTGRGAIRGRLSYSLFASRDLELTIGDLDLPDLVLTAPQGQGRLSGRLKGTVTVLGQGLVIPTGGQGTLEITSGRLEGLKIPNIPTENLDFDRLELRFKLNRDDLTVERFEIDGPRVGMLLTGRLIDYRQPRLNLSGTARLGPAAQPLARSGLTITGPLARPQIRLGAGG